MQQQRWKYWCVLSHYLASIRVAGLTTGFAAELLMEKSFIFSTGSFFVLAADHHEVLCRSCGKEVKTCQNEIQEVDRYKWIHHNHAIHFRWIQNAEYRIQNTLQMNLKPFQLQVADPAFLKVSPLSPDYLHRQVCICRRINLFVCLSNVFSCFRIWHYSGQLWDYPWKSWEIQQVNLLSHFYFSQIYKFRFWVWGGHLWKNWLCWGWILDPWGVLVSRLPLEGLYLPTVQVLTK